MKNGIRCRPDGTRAWRVVFPREPWRQDVRNGLMVKARINLGVLDTSGRRIRIRMNQFDSGRGSRNTSRASDCHRPSSVFRGEDAHVVIGCTGSRCASKDKLMGGKTWALIGLEHIVCPPILGRER